MPEATLRGRFICTTARTSNGISGCVPLETRGLEQEITYDNGVNVKALWEIQCKCNKQGMFVVFTSHRRIESAVYFGFKLVCPLGYAVNVDFVAKCGYRYVRRRGVAIRATATVWGGKAVGDESELVRHQGRYLG